MFQTIFRSSGLTYCAQLVQFQIDATRMYSLAEETSEKLYHRQSVLF
jgi:hypothetical protein